MTTTQVTPLQKSILARLRKTRAGIALISHVWETPEGEWPETKQARLQATDALPDRVKLKDAMDAVRAAGLVEHIHPSRK